MSRIEKTFRCTKDGRAVARIEVLDAKRWLVRLAARDGHARSLEATMQDAAKEFQDERELQIRALGEERYVTTLERLTNYDANGKEQREQLPSELDIGFHALGMEPMPWNGACPKCHTPYVFTVSIREDAPCVVLMSKA